MLATNFDADGAPDDVELLDVDANISHASMPQYDRGDLLGESLDKIDMAAADDETNRVENDVIGKDRAHVVGVRAGASHQSFDLEQYALLRVAFGFISADLRRNDEITHENPIDFALDVASANDSTSEQPPVDLRRGVRIGPFTRDQVTDERDGL